MAVTAPYSRLDLINEAAELLGIVSPAGLTNSDDANSCLRSLNLMLSAWSGKGLSARAYVTETFPIVGGQRQYSWGTTGTPDFNSTRPTKIITAGLVYVNNNNLIIPMEIIGSDHYQAFGDRLIVSGPPQAVFPDMLMPNAVINIYPIPDQGYNIVFTSDKALSEVTDVNTLFALDEVYYEPIVTNLAVRIAPKFGKTNIQDVRKLADAAMASLINLTSPDMFYGSDVPLSRTGLNAPILDGGYSD